MRLLAFLASLFAPAPTTRRTLTEAEMRDALERRRKRQAEKRDATRKKARSVRGELRAIEQRYSVSPLVRSLIWSVAC